MSGRIEDQVKAEIASRRLHPDDGYSYEECNGPSCRAIRDAAARAAAPPECGAPAVGGPCILPRAHNMGYVDIPSNHRAAAPPVEPQWECVVCHRDVAESARVAHEMANPGHGWSSPDRVAGLREAALRHLDFLEGHHYHQVYGDGSDGADHTTPRERPMASEREWEFTDNPDDPCGYCVQWEENEDGTDARPIEPDGSTVPRMYRFTHKECDAAVFAYIAEAPDA